MTEYNHVNDSGVREDFSTGSRRDTRDGKGRYDLLPVRSMKRLAKHFENGAKKYGDNNWQKGQPMSRYMDSAIRHLFNYLGGMDDEDHLIACAWNVICACETEERIFDGSLDPILNDIPKYTSIEAPDSRVKAMRLEDYMKITKWFVHDSSYDGKYVIVTDDVYTMVWTGFLDNSWLPLEFKSGDSDFWSQKFPHIFEDESRLYLDTCVQMLNNIYEKNNKE